MSKSDELTTIKVTKDTRTLLRAMAAWTGESMYECLDRIMRDKVRSVVPMTIDSILEKGNE